MMDENKEKQHETAGEEKPAFVPASFEKRVAAWVGVAYMVMLLLATTCMFALGRPLNNVFPLLLVPGSVGVAVVGIYREKHGKVNVKDGRYFTPALVFLCFLAFVIGLVCGIPPLLANFGIATPLIPNP